MSWYTSPYLWIAGLFLILMLAGSCNIKRPNGHNVGCYCDTCCYQGYCEVVNPQAPSYVD